MKPETAATLFSQKKILEGYFLMILRVPAPFGRSLPGQFVMLRAETDGYPFLSRPFSIYSAYSRGDETFVEILYKVVGKGTEVFSRLQEGDLLRILGPLGRGFEVPPSHGRIILIAGGVGVAPLAFLAQHCREKDHNARIICYLGAGSMETIVGLDRLQEICSAVKISTDDGSKGYRGPVTGLFRRDIDRYSGDDVRIYSCGPRPMLRDLQGLLRGRSVVCQVSLEERMACGIGACLGCVVRTREGDERGGLVRVCAEGPVFDIDRVGFGE